MTREQQTANDMRYRDWREAYDDDVRQRVKHWGDKRKRANSGLRDVGGLDAALFEPARD